MFVAGSQIDLLIRTVVLGPLALAWILVVVRVIGLRSFSKMIAVDFVVTVATGSLLAQAVTAKEWPTFAQSCGAIAMLLATQGAFTAVRRRRGGRISAVENAPALLMRDGELMREEMAENRISEADVWSKLREANVQDLSQVRAVVLETTGDISVLTGERIDQRLLRGVTDAMSQDSTTH